jgi:aldehyde dehydrogenase (NAD+)
MGLTTTEAAAVVRRLAAQGLLIGGDWVPSGGGGAYAHHNASTGAVQAEVALADADDVDRAVRAARTALPVWQAVPTTKRIAILHRLADLLDEHRAEACAINALDNGTPISIIDSGTYTGAWTRYYAGWIDKLTGAVAPTPTSTSRARSAVSSAP